MKEERKIIPLSAYFVKDFCDKHKISVEELREKLKKSVERMRNWCEKNNLYY